MTHTIEIIHGDALTFRPEWARGFQALMSDPPYSPHVHANITSAGTMGAGSRGYHRQELEFAPLSPELMAHMAAVIVRVQGWALVYSDHESSHLWRAAVMNAHGEYVRSELALLEDGLTLEEAEANVDAGVMPWERWSQPQKSGDRPTQGFEVLSLFWGRRGSRKAWNGPGSCTSFRHKSLRGDDKHRTEKPLDQALDMVSWFSNAPHLPWGQHSEFIAPDTPDVRPVVASAHADGRVFISVPSQSAILPVLDLTGGAGTIATACALLGRSCVSFELIEHWAQAGERRATEALAGKISPRDRERAERWVLSAMAEAQTVPYPKAEDGSDVKTWERAQRRLADARYLGERL